MIQFLGIRPIGTKKDGTPKIIISFNVSASVTDIRQAVGVPGQNDNIGASWLESVLCNLQPAQYQQSFDFGPLKLVRVSGMLYKQRIQQDGSGNGFTPGRVFLYSQSTQEIYVIYPKQSLVSIVLAGGWNQFGVEAVNETFHFSALESSSIQVWLEGDNLNGGAALPSATLFVEILNFDEND